MVLILQLMDFIPKGAMVAFMEALIGNSCQTYSYSMMDGNNRSVLDQSHAFAGAKI